MIVALTAITAAVLATVVALCCVIVGSRFER